MKKIFIISIMIVACCVFSSCTVEDTNTATIQTTANSLDGVQKWYQEETPTAAQSLVDYAQSSVNGISDIKITENKFRFGEDSGWYECHYTFYFSCKVNGVKCGGEARAFRKYKDDTINWFHFEIYRDSDWGIITEQYDESYDTIIEEYYKELEQQYAQ